MFVNNRQTDAWHGTSGNAGSEYAGAEVNPSSFDQQITRSGLPLLRILRYKDPLIP